MQTLRHHLSYLLLGGILTLFSCAERINNEARCQQLTDEEAILNAAISYLFVPRQVCEQTYDDFFRKDTFELLFSKYSIPAFDTMPCYPALYFLYNERTFTEEECVVAGVGVLDHERIRQLFPSESIIRAETYLGMGKKVLDGAVDYSKLDFSKMGGKLILPEAPCDRRHASIQCSFSGVYVDEKEEKAILYLRLMLTSEYRYVYYFQKVGQLWLLKVREDCPAQ